MSQQIKYHFREAHRRLSKILDISEGVTFSDELREIMIEDLRRLRELIDQLTEAIERGDQS